MNRRKTKREGTGVTVRLPLRVSRTRLLEILLPSQYPKSPTDRWKAENLAISAALTLLFMPAYSLFYLVLGDVISASLCVAGALGSLVSLILIRTASVIAARESLLLTIYSLLLSLTYRLGGVHAPTVVWLAVCPLIAANAGGIRSGLVWAIVCFFAVIAIHVIDAAGMFPTPVVENLRVLATVSTLSFFVTLAIFILLFHETNANAIMRLNEALILLRDLAVRDELTGAINRRELIRIAQQEKERSDQNGTAFSLCLLDVDDFKRINDTWGHAAGDHVLRRLAASLMNASRKTDFFGRYGGEEFLLLLGDSDAKAAQDLSERIRKMVEALTFEEVDELQSVTVSIGVAQYCSGETIDQALSRADCALYKAKSSGRNRVCVAASGPLRQLP